MRRSEFRKPETAWWARESAFTSMAPNPRARAREGRGCCRRRHFFLLNSFERNPVRGEDGEVGRSGRTRGARRASDVGQPSDPRSERPAIGPTCSSRLGGAAAAGRTMVRSTAAPSRGIWLGATMELGRSRRTLMMMLLLRPAAARRRRATGSSPGAFLLFIR